MNGLLQADPATLPAWLRELLQREQRDLFGVPRPAFRVPDGLTAVLTTLTSTSLAIFDPDASTLFVHRWTAAELTRQWVGALSTAAELRRAHRAAAAYWLWRVEVWPQDRQADVADQLEARHHLLDAGDSDAAATITENICNSLHGWGAWDQEATLIHDTIPRLSPDHPRQPAWLHQLGILAQVRGDYPEAERRYRQSLEIKERLGDQSGASISYHNLGIVAQARGDYPEAERLYRQALEIKERLGDQSGASDSYGQLGILAQDRGDYPEAERLYRQSLQIKERLGDQLGASKSYQQLGALAHESGDYPGAERLYRHALDIKERLGDQESIAWTISQLGILATLQEHLAEAVPLQLRALSSRLHLGSPEVENDLHWLRVQRDAMDRSAFAAILTAHLEAEDVEAVLGLLDHTPESGDDGT